jgi:hypothetical protein
MSKRWFIVNMSWKKNEYKAEGNLNSVMIDINVSLKVNKGRVADILN